MKARSILLIMLLAVTACDSGLKSPSDAFLIPQDQIPEITKQANAGDVAAVKRLIAHYEATSENDAISEKWKEKARALGDAQELYYYAARLFTGARTEIDPVKKREMLMEAIKAAERSSSSRADTSTQKLIDDINLSLKNVP